MRLGRTSAVVVLAGLIIFTAVVVLIGQTRPDGVGPQQPRPDTQRSTGGTPTIEPGIHAMFQAEVLDEEIDENSDLVKALQQPYLEGIGLQVGWIHLAPSEDEPDGDPSRIGYFLDRIAQAEVVAGRTSHVPVFLKYYPDDLPLWLRISNPTTTPTLNVNSLGMKVVSDSSLPGFYHQNTDMPISTDEVYQQHVERQMEVMNAGLEQYDADASRVTALGFMAPFMSSAQMRVPYTPIEGWGQTGPDPLGAGWTKAGHIAAIKSFVPVMAGLSAFDQRAWAFNYTSTPLLDASDQQGVKDALADAHPRGSDAVLSKTENLTVTYQGPRNPDRTDTFLEALDRPDFNGTMVMDEAHHGWELFAPLSEGCTTCGGPTLMPQSEWSQLAANSLFTDPAPGERTTLQHTVWVEVWLRDLVAPTSFLDEFLTQWNDDIKANAWQPD